MKIGQSRAFHQIIWIIKQDSHYADTSHVYMLDLCSLVSYENI